MEFQDDKPNKDTGSVNELDRLLSERTERLKELACINQTTQIIREGKPQAETLKQIALILPKAWQFPEYSTARITFDGKTYTSSAFSESGWFQRQSFETVDQRKGCIELFYLKKFSDSDEGPFLKEERHLINNLAELIAGYLNSIRAKDMLFKARTELSTSSRKPFTPVKEVTGKQLLQRFLNKNNADRDVYHDLMAFKVKEILLVANLYDAYSIEKEGRFSEHVLGEYHQLNLSSVPRITGVSSEEEAINQLYLKHYDLVIFMVGPDKKAPISISRIIKDEFPYIPVFFLLNNNSDLEYYTTDESSVQHVDKIFVWNGDSKIFFAMIKLVEDKINAENDTQVGLVRVILLVEDSPQYYSRYLPMLYNIVMEQTRRIIDDVSTDELYKVLRMRARPKILLAATFEEAIEIYSRYSEYLLCLITDVRFNRNGVHDPNAGIDLVRHIKGRIKDLPVIIQSSEPENADLAYRHQASFIDKNSDSLMQDFKSFIMHYLGFGNFIYRNNDGNQIAIAKSLKEFEQHLATIPDDSLIYHARRNHFSLWLMARGEIQVAKIINPAKVTDFTSPAALRAYLLNVISKFRNEQNKGKIIPYEENAILDESNIVNLSTGALGGKGRGIAFIHTLIYNYDFAQHIPNINIRAPRTAIIGTDEFEYFMESNKLYDKVFELKDYEELKQVFIEAELTPTLARRLKRMLRLITRPIAIRSSGLFEDSLMQPFAGIFETYLLPNNHPDIAVRLNQTMDAIKLVYASVFSKVARGYIEAINYKIEEEKMAIVIQEVVGNQYGNAFYPHISGVAQSYNYYPFAHMKPEEGFAVLALGLGKHVVEGEKAYRFSPQYPATDISSPIDQYKNSQLDFYAVDLAKEHLNLLEGDTAGLVKLDIEEAERQGTLKHLASVYDNENSVITPGINQPGPRILNFANILRYEYIPLAKTIEVVLDIVKEAMGTPVEIEFAVDLNKDKDYRASFYLLQIKPLIGTSMDFSIDLDSINEEKVVMFSEKGMGNGLISDIYDLIYVEPSLFDKTRTEQMAAEIEKLNRSMIEQGKKYVLIGPGRWGTRDRFIGIPVNWPQISHAKVIVETSLEDFPLDASSGSHFFHNVTSMNVGYFSVQHMLSRNIIRFDLLSKQKLVSKTEFFRHVRFEKPLNIMMDGKKRIAVILLDE